MLILHFKKKIGVKPIIMAKILSLALDIDLIIFSG